MTFRDETSNPAEKFCVDLGNGFYALKFQYHMVTELTVSKAIRRDMTIYGKPVKFAPENESQAGKLRMDAALMTINHFSKVEKAKSIGLNLADYILIELI